MNEIVHGKDVNVEARVNGDYIAIGCAFSCSFEFENELIGKTDVNAGLSRKKRVRISDCRGSVQGVTTLNNSATRLTAFYFLQEAIRRTEQDLRFVFVDEVGNIRYIQCLFLVKSHQLTGESTGFSEFDLQLEGTGSPTIGTVDTSTENICPELFSDTWETVVDEFSISGLGQEGRSFADGDILEVDREGLQYDFTAGTPGNREFGYDGTTITFENAFIDGERVLVVWKSFDS